jgi:hypothetical protein
MKTKILLFGMMLSILTFSSCSQDPSSSTNESIVTTNDVIETQKMDNAVDDITLIADDQYEVIEGAVTGKASRNYKSILPECVTVSDLGSTDLIKKNTLTFGTATTSCVFRGRALKGQIILTHTKGTSFPKVMTITFNNFYINYNKLEGIITWTREMVGDETTFHPKTTYTMTAMTLTTISGVFTRNGTRTREMTAGFLTRLNLADDVYSTYGTFTTTNPTGTVFTSLIESVNPLINKTDCSLLQTPMPFPVSGIAKLSNNLHYATIDYGTGDCDNFALLSIDGGAATQITLYK